MQIAGIHTQNVAIILGGGTLARDCGADVILLGHAQRNSECLGMLPLQQGLS